MSNVIIEVIEENVGNPATHRSALIVRHNDSVRQWPWMINNTARYAAEAAVRELREQLPDTPQTWIGFVPKTIL